MENNTSKDTPAKITTNLDVVPAILPADIPRLAIAAANIGTWFLDEQSRTFLPSDRMKELHGYLPDEEMSFDDALAQIPDTFRKKVVNILKKASNKHEPFYMEYPVVGKNDQKQRWLRVMGGADQEGEIAHFSGVAMDITDQKQNELRRNKFIGMVSHELKTPLTTLKAYIQLLSKWARQKKDNFTLGTLSKLENQVRKMTGMVNGFLNFSGAESGKIHLNKQDFSLRVALQEVLDETKVNSPDQVIELTTNCQDINLNADREKITLVIGNLISNAIKYSYPEKPIEISCHQEKSTVKLSIKDHGIGIDKEDVQKLFKPHSRIKTSETTNIPGFGIGLYLCQEIIKNHGGEIGVESEPGKGSIFWFTLPHVIGLPAQ